MPPRLQRTLTLRADGSFLGVIEPGRLTMYSPTLVPDQTQVVRDIRTTEIIERSHKTAFRVFLTLNFAFPHLTEAPTVKAPL